ncbi:MAG: class I SAM-dependent methyltransferase [Gammaproteobacteria bacterium]|nr:class I SAM-dependent methyltransferase [Gammaproteobacteria bacterium]MCW8973912.1 class I SAM-dependent methyltransferase [Gammaproteobacteria bacterium]MCW8992913.1 class I SAM-dependent methyltransferase [Gammaproteobacteria bacterium]
MKPAAYENWYRSKRGSWIAGREFALLTHLVRPSPGESLLDLGTGTGHFARRFAAAGLAVSGLDPDRAALDYARSLAGGVDYLQGDMQTLPFADASFDYCSAVTSLCFVAEPQRALGEMWRVARRGVILGLLNRHSLLHWQKAGHGGYRGARWDSAAEVRAWADRLPGVSQPRFGSAIFLPGGGRLAAAAERIAPPRPLWGGFLAVYLKKMT